MCINDQASAFDRHFKAISDKSLKGHEVIFLENTVKFQSIQGTNVMLRVPHLIRNYIVVTFELIRKRKNPFNSTEVYIIAHL